ncbi:hypothetical protein [Agromyces sp. H66]|uniref:hypothetical protein n=1 Tax=Agromyces sp. H66 TaxID=2529859 RepID=UPI0010AB43EC|nr:hypothetical protein [Agromyces sp. H66]
MDDHDDSPIDRDAAEARLHEARAAGRRVSVEGSASASAWLTGLAAASAVYLAALGWFARTDEAAILGVSLAFAAVLGVLAVVHLRRIRASSLGFSRRFGIAMGAWGACFAASLGAGLLIFPGSVAFFAVAAAVTAVPPLWGSVRELVVVRG